MYFSNVSFHVARTAMVSSFEVFGTSGSIVTRDEFTPAIFICIVSSPITTNISLTKDGNTVSYVVSNTQLVYTIDKSSCDDMGTYICSVSSDDVDEPASASIEYFVQCK